MAHLRPEKRTSRLVFAVVGLCGRPSLRTIHPRKIMKNPDSESLFGDDHGEDTYHFWDVESLNPSNQYMILIVINGENHPFYMVGLWHWLCHIEKSYVHLNDI